MNQACKKSISGFTLMILTVAAAPLWCHAAGDPSLDSWLDGTWSGTVKTQKGATDVDITIAATRASNKKLIYANPRGCTAEVRYLRNSGPNNDYEVTSSNGGVCDKLTGNKVSLKKNSDGTLSYSAYGSKTIESGLLRK